MLRDLLFRLRAIFRHSAVETELDDELRFHLEQEAARHRLAGASPEEALRRARLALGGPEQVKEQCRDARGTRWVEEVGRDLRYALRQLRHAPGFTAVAVLTLALGIGANTALFTVFNAVLLRPLPYANSERLVHLVRQPQGQLFYPVSTAKFLFWQRESRTTEAVAACDLFGSGLSLTGTGEAERVRSVRASADLFRVLQVSPAMGRGFTRQEDRPGGGHVAVLSHGLWHRRFGGDPAVVGRAVVLNGESHTITGVLPAGFQFNPEADIWVPLRAVLDARDQAHAFQVIGRLRAGITLQQAQADLARVAALYRRQHAGLIDPRESASARPLQDRVTGNIRDSLLILMGAVGLVLLIACANVMHLLLARATVRTREMAVRTALGASRSRILRQLLTESFLLAVLGGALGLLLALCSLPLLLKLSPRDLPRLQEIAIDGHVLLFTVAATLLSTVLFALAPAWQVHGWANREVLGEGAGRTTGATGGRRILNGLVAGEVALSLVLLAGAGLLIRSFVLLRQVEPGFDPRGVLTMQMSLGGAGYATTADVTRLYQRVIPRLEALPGVEAAATVTTLPLEPTLQFPIEMEGRSASDARREGEANWRAIAGQYLSVMRIPLRAGRAFNERDTASSPAVVLINETLARRYFPGRNPLGERVTIGRIMGPAFADRPRKIVGVVADAKESDLRSGVPGAVLVPAAQVPDAMAAQVSRMLPVNWVVRTTRDSPASPDAMRRELRDVESELPVANVRPLEHVLVQSLETQRLNALLLGGLSTLALVLAAVGLYGVTAYAVAQRRREIGVRVALGATQGNIVRLVLTYALSMVATGVTVGLAGSWALSRVLSGLLFGVAPNDPATFATVPVLLTVVAALACWVPVRRATRVSPVLALREE